MLGALYGQPLGGSGGTWGPSSRLNPYLVGQCPGSIPVLPRPRPATKHRDALAAPSTWGTGGKGKGRAEVQGPSGAPGISGMGRAMQARARRHRQQPQGLGALISAGKNILRSIFAGAAPLALPVDAQEHRFEADPVVTVRENL